MAVIHAVTRNAVGNPVDALVTNTVNRDLIFHSFIYTGSALVLRSRDGAQFRRTAFGAGTN
jgi:hypothetical protein